MKVWTKVEEPAEHRVIIPYTKPTPLLQTVVDCLRHQRVQPELHRVNDGSGYHDLLRASWADGREFFVVEHDVLVWQGAIAAMAACDGRWCTLPTLCHGRYLETTLGCVKFSQQLIERNPDIWDEIPTTWYRLDASFADRIGWPYIRPHAHGPAATHLNEIQWPDGISRRWAVARKLAWQAHEAGEAVVAVNYRGEERPRWWRRKQQRLGTGPPTITADEEEPARRSAPIR